MGRMEGKRRRKEEMSETEEAGEALRSYIPPLLHRGVETGR
jgi:hypothetical protein